MINVHLRRDLVEQHLAAYRHPARRTTSLPDLDRKLVEVPDCAV